MTICPIPQQKKKNFFYRRIIWVFFWCLFDLLLKGGGMTGKCFRNRDAQSFMGRLFHSDQKNKFCFLFSLLPSTLMHLQSLFANCDVFFLFKKKLQENMHYIELGLKVLHPSIVNLIYLSLYVIILFHLEYT